MVGPAADAEDPYDLARFLQAHERDYERALSEIRAGRKRTHWIWYIFPQIDGLGFSETTRFYAIKSIDEARAYLAHRVLGARLKECAEALLGVEGRSAREILGPPDDLKVWSSMTLFGHVSEPGSPFVKVLEKYYSGEQDERTLRLIGAAGAG